jgi:hypothetical protein
MKEQVRGARESGKTDVTRAYAQTKTTRIQNTPAATAPDMVTSQQLSPSHENRTVGGTEHHIYRDQ